MINRFAGIAVGLALAIAAAGCSGAPELLPATRPLSKEAMMLLGKKGMKPEAPIFVRIFKEESELEVWKRRDDGHFYHFKTYPICTWSGELGPKQAQGDRQAPEGFYTIQKGQMNPNSMFHLAFNLGYPNAYDKAHGRTGSALMVHGKCKSAGCYAMTDALIEEIYALARESFDGGNASFDVHAYPFRMTDANMARHRTSKWFAFWKTMKEGYDYFEQTRQTPPVLVCGRNYVVNARPVQNASLRSLDPIASCPQLERLAVTPFLPSGDQHVAQVVAPGPKMRAVASIQGAQQAPAPRSVGSISGLLGGMMSAGAKGSTPAFSFTAPNN
ncbi:MAG: murein L,D-transpeptidase family protein [Hyphomicrobiaceae bacterium]